MNAKLFFILHITLLFVSVMDGAQDSETKAQHSDEVSQLVVKLPQAKNATEVFSVFAEHVALLFGGLIHISILLLPKESSTTGGQPSGTSNAQSKAGNNSTQKASSRNKEQNSAKSQRNNRNDNKSIHRADSQHKFAEQKGWEHLGSQGAKSLLDWSNCCVFHVFKGRGPIVQQPPSWPLQCTATHHAGVVSGEALVTGSYSTQGPHFLDWKALHEKGAESLVAVPMFSCNQAIGVLCLASSDKDAFERLELVKLLSSILAPYVQLLEYTTRRMEMQKLVNEIITPIAAQLAQQKSQLSRLGCSVEEDTSIDANGEKKRTPSPPAPFDNLRATQSLKVSCSSSLAARRAQAAAARAAAAAGGSGGVVKAPLAAGPNSVQGVAGAGAPSTGQSNGNGGKGKGSAGGKKGHHHHNHQAQQQQQQQQHHVEPAIGKHHTFELEQMSAPPPEVDLDWGDFFFNLVSMCIVYVYFSKAAVAGESLVAILLCMGVAAFDIVLLVMRWLWFEHYIHYGNLVLHVFQIYRVVVLPVANTWMSWSLIHKMDFRPSTSIILAMGALLLGCVIIGLQVRFFLHAPLQLASVLFAATSTSDMCSALFGTTSSIGCIGAVSALQLSLGLVLPSLMVQLLEARSGRTFLPHVQAKRWLLHP